MNWGYKIALVYILFASGLMGMVFMATSQEYHLVTENYYQKELEHDDLMAAKRNSSALKEPIRIHYDGMAKGVSISFPSDKADIQGELHFYHTVNAHKDQLFPLDTLQQDRVFIPREAIGPGRWKLKVSWQSEDLAFFDEKSLIIP